MAKSYSEKLKDPRWQRKRLEVMQRDNFTCVLCGDDKTTLSVHHLEYNGEPWEQTIDKLQTLCEGCHILAESSKKHQRLNGLRKVLRIKQDDFTIIMTKYSENNCIYLCGDDGFVTAIRIHNSNANLVSNFLSEGGKNG